MQDLLAALCLVLVIEGLLPFASPRAYRDTVRQVSELDDKTMRGIGAVSIVLGLILLNVVR